MRRFACILTGLILLLSLAAPAYADTMTGGDWYCRFTANEEMDTNYGDADDIADDLLLGLQPGDEAIFYMELQNLHPQTTDWYMENKVVQSLEQTEDQFAASGGAYTYDLRYVGPDGEELVIYSSDEVGGSKSVFDDDREGLREATGVLEDFFYLDTLGSGQAGHITLKVALEGETQGNAYQDTLAKLQMNFAVELSDNTPPPNATPSPTPSTPGSTPTPSSPGTTTSTPRPTSTPDTFTPVRTGDEADPLLWAGIMLGCGVVALALCIFMMRRNRKRNREDDRDE